LTFEEFDKAHMYNFRKDRLAIAKDHGFDFISEATVGLYLNLRSTIKVGKLLGISAAAALVEINQLYMAGLCPYKRGRGGRYDNS